MTAYAIAQVPGAATPALHDKESWKSRVKGKFFEQVDAPQSVDLDAIKAILSTPSVTKYLEFKVEQLVAESLAPKPTPGSLVYKALDKKMNFLEDYAASSS